ncbi:hypothetical protein EDB89DRAFT_1904657 [Lactarius sanguifluus]|nr:hypothetical protein EDB89DRAFT_1904657 [Lactarius sanguifluus]
MSEEKRARRNKFPRWTAGWHLRSTGMVPEQGRGPLFTSHMMGYVRTCLTITPLYFPDSLSTAHYDIFRDQLGIKYPAFGNALWEPNPGRLYSPVEVGDVGFIREGKFHRLFNALLPADHPSHPSFGVPEHYEPLQPSVADHIVQSPNDFCSYGITVASGGLDVFARERCRRLILCARKSGAVLSLPVAAQREDTIARGDFAKWITRHIYSWLAFTRGLGLGIEQMVDIVLVTGRHRTRSWTNIAFYEGQAAAQVSFGVRVTDDVNATSVNWQVSRTQIQGAMLSQGPSGDDLPEDQCIFVRGFRVARAFKLFPRLRGAAGYAPDPSGPDKYIAGRAPDCDLVLVHDDDLDRLRRIGDGTSLETLQADALVGCLQNSGPEIARVGYDPLSSENKTPRTNTRGSMVAMFSEEFSSWGGSFFVSQRQDRFPPSVTTHFGPVLVSPSTHPEAETLSPAPVAMQAASPRPQPRRRIQLQSQPSQLQPQPYVDEAKKRLARELFLHKDRRPSPKRDAKHDDLGRLSSVSTTTSISSEERALSLMSAASSQTRASVYSSLFDSPPLLDPPMVPSSQAHATVSSFDTSHEYILTSRGRDYATVVVVSRAPNILDPPLLHFGDELKGRIVMRIDSLTDMRIMEVVVDESCISGGQFSWPFVIPPPPVLSSSSSSTAASGSSDSSLGQYLIRDHHDKPKVQLIVTFCRHGRLTRNLVLRQPIHYIPPPDPVTTPPPLIPTNHPTDPFVDPPDLSVDPSWAQQTFPVILVKGVMFRQLQVEVTCKLVVPVRYALFLLVPSLILDYPRFRTQ